MFVLATFALMTKDSKETRPKIQQRFELEQVPYIYYFTWFSKFLVEALIDLGSKCQSLKKMYLIWVILKKI